MKVTEVKVGEKTMFVCDSSEKAEEAKIRNDDPHAHYAIRRAEIHVELAAFRKVAKRISDVDSVLEMFGGSGWHSSIIQSLHSPTKHKALDVSGDCVASIRRSLPEVQSYKCDSYERIKSYGSGEFDWVHADFNQLTYNRYLKEARYKDAVDKVFDMSKKWVTITDSAIFGLCRFEANRNSYVKSLGMDAHHWEDYFCKVADVFKKKYGFGCQNVRAWHKMSAMFLFKKGVENDFVVNHVSEKIPVKIVRIFEE